MPRVVVHYQETGGITLDAQLRVADADAAPLGDLRKVASRARRRLLDAAPDVSTSLSVVLDDLDEAAAEGTSKTAPVAA